MAPSTESYRTPYTPTPGTSTAPAEMTPEEGVADLWAFFWVTIASIVIIAVAGLAAWFYVHP
ncbi:MAG TPA: hypothetical protein VMC82_03590 [Thermoplasmata archaeon]|nr:hypothetical protein [Thermoplasmata archaeon]